MVLKEQMGALVVPELVQHLEFAVVQQETWRQHVVVHVLQRPSGSSPELLIRHELLNYYENVSEKHFASWQLLWTPAWVDYVSAIHHLLH